MSAPPLALPRNQILIGDALEQLRQLPSSSVDTVVTSPPYFRLRDYGASRQLGLENHVDDWVSSLRAVINECRRVLVPTGTLWLNLGDTYATHTRQGAARKGLLLAPEKLIRALADDGWLVRNKIIWAKTNPMPTSVTDRLSATWEVVYLLAKQPHYFFALDAIRLPHRSMASSAPSRHRATTRSESWRGPNADRPTGLAALKASGVAGHPLGKNPGDVWPLSTGRSQQGHHATFPIALATRMIAAGCPEHRCTACRAPWRRPLLRSRDTAGRPQARRGELQATCACRASSEPGLVLDPFMGSGTTAVAAQRLGRAWTGIELNEQFAADARLRTSEEAAHAEAVA